MLYCSLSVLSLYIYDMSLSYTYARPQTHRLVRSPFHGRFGCMCKTESTYILRQFGERNYHGSKRKCNRIGWFFCSFDTSSQMFGRLPCAWCSTLVSIRHIGDFCVNYTHLLFFFPFVLSISTRKSFAALFFRSLSRKTLAVILHSMFFLVVVVFSRCWYIQFVWCVNFVPAERQRKKAPNLLFVNCDCKLCANRKKEVAKKKFSI